MAANMAALKCALEMCKRAFLGSFGAGSRPVLPVRDINSQTTAVTRIKRLKYARMYPTLLVRPDGSTLTIRYHEPRKIIKLPLDLSTLTEEERRIRLELRKPRKKRVVQDDIEDTFDANQYKHLWKN